MINKSNKVLMISNTIIPMRRLTKNTEGCRIHINLKYKKESNNWLTNSDIDNLIRNIEDMLRNVLAMSQELDISQIHKIDQTLCTSIQIFFVILFFKDMNILFISFCY